MIATAPVWDSGGGVWEHPEGVSGRVSQEWSFESLELWGDSEKWLGASRWKAWSLSLRRQAPEIAAGVEGEGGVWERAPSWLQGGQRGSLSGNPGQVMSDPAWG